MPNVSEIDHKADPPIVHFLFEPGNGGLDRVAILLANGMAERGLATELWLTKLDGHLAGLISDSVTVRQVPAPEWGSRGLRLFLQIPALAKMIRKHQPRAVFSAGNQSNLTIALARLLARQDETKIIQKITNPVIRPAMGRFSGWLRAVRFGLTAWLGDLSLTLSEADARNYAHLMPRAANRFRAVHNAYISDAMLAKGMLCQAEREQVEPTGAPCRLLAVGRLAYQKDHATMLRALARLTDLNWHLRMLGDGPLLPDLERQAAELGIADRISFEGFVEDPGEAYAASDILLLSSRWEGFPAVPLEAMAFGCDVVTTDCSDGLAEILQPLGRAAVPIGDDRAFAQAIRAAIGGDITPNHPSNQRSPEMRKIAAKYSISASVSDHLRLIDVCQGRQAAVVGVSG